jgi:hypothetical protein
MRAWIRLGDCKMPSHHRHRHQHQIIIVVERTKACNRAAAGSKSYAGVRMGEPLPPKFDGSNKREAKLLNRLIQRGRRRGGKGGDRG